MSPDRMQEGVSGGRARTVETADGARTGSTLVVYSAAVGHAELDFIRDISPHDKMRMGTDENYFRWGLDALAYVRIALALARRDRVHRILDLPSGHGRVLRMLASAFPESTVTACDTDTDAVDFCAQVLGAEPVYSVENPDELDFSTRFDLIWCGSLFTHTDADRWHDLLRLFGRSLARWCACIHDTRTVHRRRGGTGTSALRDRGSRSARE
jgi:SAM-dependent methyltransferase